MQCNPHTVSPQWGYLLPVALACFDEDDDAAGQRGPTAKCAWEFIPLPHPRKREPDTTVAQRGKRLDHRPELRGDDLLPAQMLFAEAARINHPEFPQRRLCAAVHRHLHLPRKLRQRLNLSGNTRRAHIPMSKPSPRRIAGSSPKYMSRAAVSRLIPKEIDAITKTQPFNHQAPPTQTGDSSQKEAVDKTYQEIHRTQGALDPFLLRASKCSAPGHRVRQILLNLSDELAIPLKRP